MSLELAPKIQERILTQRDRERQIRRRGEDRIFCVGSYNQPEDDVVEHYHPIREVPTREDKQVTLEGYEVFLHDIAPHLIKVKPNSPVIILDVGGGAGGTLNKLALAMQDEIQESRVAFVTSNIAASPDEQLGTHRIKRIGRNIPVSYDLNQISKELNKARSLVHFINGRFATLQRQSITLPNGEELALKGNVDFINEKYSVTTHSLTPELDIPRVAGLLSPYGTYAINRASFVDNNTIDVFVPQRQKAIEVAHETLQKNLDLRKVTMVEEGRFDGVPLHNHLIFKASKAPLYNVN